MPETVTLREYERRTLPLTDTQARELTAVGRGAIRVESTATSGTYDVIASAQVGTIVTSSLELLIRPKVKLDNLLYLLGVGIDDIRWWRDTFTYESRDELLPAFLAFFARTLRHSLEAGLLRDYRWEEEFLSTLRGRIDFTEVVRRRGKPYPMPCRYEEFTADSLLNRYLRAAVRAGLRYARVPPAVRRLLLGELAQFEGVADETPRLDAIDGHVFTRLDAHYETPLRLARLLLSGGTLVDRAGAVAGSAFLIDMNRLFEDFVAVELRRRLTPSLDLHREPHRHLDTSKKVLLKPDIDIREDGRSVYVADVKYKLSDSGIARNSDYYQLLAYTTAMELPEGLLIYYLDGGDRPPRSIDVRGTQKELITYLLDLSGSIHDLESAMDGLASYMTDRVRRRPTVVRVA